MLCAAGCCQGSLNTFHGSHPLRARASRLRSEGILVIRFELPFNVNCGSCGQHVGKGTRFNADKQRVGQYLSTPIFSFSFTCHLCSGKIRIDTDPKAGEYVIQQGAKRRLDGAGGEDEDRLVVGEDEDEAALRATDALYRVEREQADVRRGQEADGVISQLVQRNARLQDDFGQSQLVRRHMRARREEAARLQSERLQKGLSMQLLPHSDGDRKEAEHVVFGKVEGLEEARRRRRRERQQSRAAAAGARGAEDEAAVLQRKWSRGVDDLTMADGRLRSRLQTGKEEERDSSERKHETDPLQRVVIVRRKSAQRTQDVQHERSPEAADAVRVRASPTEVSAAPAAVLSTLAAYASDSDDGEDDI